MNQYDIIIKLSKKKWISPIDALNAGAGMKLATRIGELKRKGYIFMDKWSSDHKFKLYKLIESST